MRRPHFARVLEPVVRRADDDDLARAGQRRERHDRLAHRPDAEHGDRLIEPDLGAVHRVQRGHETAAAADERLGREPFGSWISFTPGFIQIGSAQPPSSPSLAL